LVLVALGLVVQACAVENPVAPMGANRTVRPQPLGIEGKPPEAAADGPYFTPFDREHAPQLINRDEVSKALDDGYPRLVRDAGVGGRAEVWLQISDQGVVTDARLNRSTGQPALDIAALELARVMKFTAAQYNNQPVMVWVSIPITYTAPLPPSK
jgi:TonB family protein